MIHKLLLIVAKSILLLPFLVLHTFAQQPGNLDATFGTSGIVTTDFSSTNDNGAAAALQADGKIIVAGTTASDFALARYNTDGSLDNTFGVNGKVVTSIAINGDQATSVAIQPDGKIIAGGVSYNVSSTLNDFALVRYNTDGSVDTSFGNNGIPDH
jgi:uncharacterized delta-60 repeat protein